MGHDLGTDQPNSFWDTLEAEVGQGKGAGAGGSVSLDLTGRPVNALGNLVHSALVFDGRPKSAFHGQFWTPGVNIGQFLWEFLVRYDGNDVGQGYIISEGYGGNHAILYGLDGTPTGNIYSGTATTSFGASYRPQAGEWLHTAVGWDGTWVYVWVNGVIDGMAPFAGPRQAQAGQGGLFLGGSTHSNFQGAIAAARGFEYPAGGNPMPIVAGGTDARLAYTPDLTCSPFASSDTIAGLPAQFAVSFMDSFSQTVVDRGVGYAGSKHHGSLVAHPGNGPSWGPPQYAYDPNLAAMFAQWPPVQNRIPPSPEASPSGAKIFDSFSRKDTTPLWVPLQASKSQCTLGTTEGGSLGQLPWTTTVGSDWAVFNGTAVCCGNTQIAQGVYVQNNSGDMDVQVTRSNAAGYNPTSLAGGIAGNSTDVGLVFRLQDASNYWFLSPLHNSSQNRTSINTRVAGTNTVIANWNFPNFTWKTLRIVAAGTTITGYVDNGSTGWTQIGQVTAQTQFQTATGVGLYYTSGGTPVHFSNFTVF